MALTAMSVMVAENASVRCADFAFRAAVERHRPRNNRTGTNACYPDVEEDRYQ
jgi:hypothetical protein